MHWLVILQFHFIYTTTQNAVVINMEENLLVKSTYINYQMNQISISF